MIESCKEGPTLNVTHIFIFIIIQPFFPTPILPIQKKWYSFVFPDKYFPPIDNVFNQPQHWFWHSLCISVSLNFHAISVMTSHICVTVTFAYSQSQLTPLSCSCKKSELFSIRSMRVIFIDRAAIHWQIYYQSHFIVTLPLGSNWIRDSDILNFHHTT